MAEQKENFNEEPKNKNVFCVSPNKRSPVVQISCTSRSRNEDTRKSSHQKREKGEGHDILNIYSSIPSRSSHSRSRSMRSSELSGSRDYSRSRRQPSSKVSSSSEESETFSRHSLRKISRGASERRKSLSSSERSRSQSPVSTRNNRRKGRRIRRSRSATSSSSGTSGHRGNSDSSTPPTRRSGMYRKWENSMSPGQRKRETCRRKPSFPDGVEYVKSDRKKYRNNGWGRPGKVLFVAGFNFFTTEFDLKEIFQEFGRVAECRTVRDSRGRNNRGFGFITMETDEEADAAIEGLDQMHFKGRPLLVEKAKTNPGY